MVDLGAVPVELLDRQVSLDGASVAVVLVDRELSVLVCWGSFWWAVLEDGASGAGGEDEGHDDSR